MRKIINGVDVSYVNSDKSVRFANVNDLMEAVKNGEAESGPWYPEYTVIVQEVE